MAGAYLGHPPDLSMGAEYLARRLCFAGMGGMHIFVESDYRPLAKVGLDELSTDSCRLIQVKIEIREGYHRFWMFLQIYSHSLLRIALFYLYLTQMVIR